MFVIFVVLFIILTVSQSHKGPGDGRKLHGLRVGQIGQPFVIDEGVGEYDKVCEVDKVGEEGVGEYVDDGKEGVGEYDDEGVGEGEYDDEGEYNDEEGVDEVSKFVRLRQTHIVVSSTL